VGLRGKAGGRGSVGVGNCRGDGGRVGREGGSPGGGVLAGVTGAGSGAKAKRRAARAAECAALAEIFLALGGAATHGNYPQQGQAAAGAAVGAADAEAASSPGKPSGICQGGGWLRAEGWVEGVRSVLVAAAAAAAPLSPAVGGARAGDDDNRASPNHRLRGGRGSKASAAPSAAGWHGVGLVGSDGAGGGGGGVVVSGGAGSGARAARLQQRRDRRRARRAGAVERLELNANGLALARAPVPVPATAASVRKKRQGKEGASRAVPGGGVEAAPVALPVALFARLPHLTVLDLSDNAGLGPCTLSDPSWRAAADESRRAATAAGVASPLRPFPTEDAAAATAALAATTGSAAASAAASELTAAGPRAKTAAPGPALFRSDSDPAQIPATVIPAGRPSLPNLFSHSSPSTPRRSLPALASLLSASPRAPPLASSSARWPRNLVELRLYRCGLEGPLPADMAELTRIRTLSLWVRLHAGATPCTLHAARGDKRLAAGVHASVPPCSVFFLRFRSVRREKVPSPFYFFAYL